MNHHHLKVKFAVVALAISLTTVAPLGVSLASAAGCSFSYGFAALHTMIPNQVGGCLGDPSILSDGNTVQPTSGGLMAYNPADNLPEFTNGSITWVLGAGGLQTRWNEQRFAYEAPTSQVCGVSITKKLSSPIVGCLAAMINSEDGATP